MRNFIVDLRKNLTSGGFYLCVIMTIILLFAAEVHTELGSHNRYSVIRALMDFTPEERANEFDLCNVMVMNSACSGWLTLFVPIITAFCFVPRICAERDGNAVRFQIFRSSALKYHISQFFSGVISGGLAVALGYTVFCGIVCILFPDISEMSAFAAAMLDGNSFVFALKLLSIWLYGVFWSIPAMFCTSVLRNKYLIMCIPFFVKYGLSQTVLKLSMDAYADRENIDQKIVEFTQTADPDGLLRLNGCAYSGRILLLTGIISATLFAGYLIIRLNWRDRGA